VINQKIVIFAGVFTLSGNLIRAQEIHNRNKYFIVAIRDGINVRAKPDLNSKKLAFLPYETKGEISEHLFEPVTVQDRIGRWVRVKGVAPEGWVFSGFIITADKREDLKFTVPQSPKLEKLPSEWFRFQERVKSRKIAKERATIGGYSLFSFMTKEFFPDGTAQEGLAIVAPDRKSRYERFVPEKLLQLSANTKDFAITITYSAYPGHGHQFYILYFLDENGKLQAYNFGIGKYAGVCKNVAWGNTLAFETRLSMDGKHLYFFRRTPMCDGDYFGKNGMEVTTHHEYVQGSFAHFNLDTRQIKQFDTLTIPPEYQAAWQQSELLRAVD